MAAVSALPMRKFKKQVYGKANSRSNWNVDSFFEEDELVASEPNTLKTRQPMRETVSRSLETAAVKKQEVRPARPRPKRKDTFDIPSSDDEISTEARTISTGFQVRNRLVDDTDSSVNQLAPWERRAVQSDREVYSKRKRGDAASPEAQLKEDLMRATQSPERNRTSSSAANSEHISSSVKSPSNAKSALARLAARRTEEVRPISKRVALSSEDAEDTPRKRARTITPSPQSGEDIIMMDNIPNPKCEIEPKQSGVVDSGGDVYDFPASSDDEQSNARQRVDRAKPGKRTTKRDRFTADSTKSRMKNGISAPARLAELLATESDTTEPPTRSPSTISRRSTPQHTPSTPPPGKANSPDTAIQAKVSMTPKQSQLWNQLLPNKSVAPSPGALGMQDLYISRKRRPETSSSAHRLAKSQSDVATRRTKLVDRLKASAHSSDDDLDDESEDEGAKGTSVTRPNKEVATTPVKLAAIDRKPSELSQSQSQTSATAIQGPKITYANVRSFLPEDNLEEDLIVGFDSGTTLNPPPTKVVGKSAPTSQKSTFDLEDEDETGGSQGGIRNIHELRASGRTMAGMYDIEELLSEIHNHNLSHRSRRRSALIELANKLTNEAFVTRFVTQNCETELAVECDAASDEIADFVLAVGLSCVIASNPPEHSVRSLQDHGTTRWLAKLTGRDTNILHMAKDRKYNMSKAAQKSLADLVETMKSKASLWGDERPRLITSRLIALKSMDKLSSKLRQLGDRSDLVEDARIASILPSAAVSLLDEDVRLDSALSVSVLESLSTTPAALRWPASTLETIAQLLPRLNAESPALQHTRFLMLRLCLNLTNDNTRNCNVLAVSSTVVQYLLSAVRQGFDSLDNELEDEKRALALDLLVLSTGIMINLAEMCDLAREQAMDDDDTLSSLLATFQRGQKRMLDAESVEESVSNVAFGYLAVMLSNICQNGAAKAFVASRLPGKNLGMLVEAVEEFVLHHQKVDMMNFEGAEGAEVWGAFTQKLKAVLARLKEAELNL